MQYLRGNISKFTLTCEMILLALVFFQRWYFCVYKLVVTKKNKSVMIVTYLYEAFAIARFIKYYILVFWNRFDKTVQLSNKYFHSDFNSPLIS